MSQMSQTFNSSSQILPQQNKTTQVAPNQMILSNKPFESFIRPPPVTPYVIPFSTSTSHLLSSSTNKSNSSLPITGLIVNSTPPPIINGSVIQCAGNASDYFMIIQNKFTVHLTQKITIKNDLR